MATDLEAQQYPSSWISKVEKVLLEHQPKDEGFHIFEVPKYFRQPSADFTPTEWRFGLHNRKKLKMLSTCEVIKLPVARALGLVGLKWKAFCKDVVSDQCLRDMKQCYGLREDETILTDNVIRYILALDALFLVARLEDQLPRDERLVCTPINVKEPSPTTGFPRWDILRIDLCKIENQVPFSLIINVVSCVTKLQATTPGSYEGYMKKLIQIGAKEGAIHFMDVSGDSFETPKSLNSPSSTWKTLSCNCV